jgi:hypothetical protein
LPLGRVSLNFSPSDQRAFEAIQDLKHVHKLELKLTGLNVSSLAPLSSLTELTELTIHDDVEPPLKTAQFSPSFTTFEIGFPIASLASVASSVRNLKIGIPDRRFTRAED